MHMAGSFHHRLIAESEKRNERMNSLPLSQVVIHLFRELTRNRESYYLRILQNSDQSIKLNPYLGLSRCAVLHYVDRAKIMSAHVQIVCAKWRAA